MMDKYAGREQVTLNLDEDVISALTDEDADVARLLRDVLVEAQDEWRGLLRDYMKYDRGEFVEGSLRVHDGPDLDANLEGVFYPTWDEFYNAGCKDINDLVDHADALDVKLNPERRELLLIGAAVGSRETFEEY